MADTDWLDGSEFQHTGTYAHNWRKCPACVVERLAADLREQAEVARTSPRGKHPGIDAMTHAAALRWAADRIALGGGAP